MSAADAYAIPLGWDPVQRTVSLCAPDADHVELLLRDHPDGHGHRSVVMRPHDLGAGRVVWLARWIPAGCYYRFLVHRPWGSVEVSDPWARAVARRKAPGHATWAVATPHRPVAPRPAGVDLDPASVVLLEAHVGDLTVHPSAGARARGTYEGLAERHAAAVGGLVDVVRMGFDAVELMPLASWPVHEGDRSNHWGYMPSAMLAVAERFAAAWQTTPDDGWIGVGADGSFVDPAAELMAMVDACHRAGVGVVVDVVWNHVSLGDRNPLLLLDPGGWFHRAGDALRSHSGCGNDLRSEHPEMRALLLAAVDRWIGEIGCDGLRLDLAELLDDATLAALRARALRHRPRALLIAEPWSMAGYRPQAIASLGYAVWNDRYRNTLKGDAPERPGLLLGDHGGGIAELWRCLEGSSVERGGWLPGRHRSLSYLESHDGWTLRDFVRLARGHAPGGRDPGPIGTLDATDRATLRLAHAVLALTRGPTMWHAGQAWGRSRRDHDGHGLVDNAYDRDDAANHLDWQQRAEEPELVAWAQAWLLARRRWFAPVFAVDGPRHPQRADRGGALGLRVDAADHPQGLASVAWLNLETDALVTIHVDPSWVAILGEAEGFALRTRQPGAWTLAARSAALFAPPSARPPVASLPN